MKKIALIVLLVCLLTGCAPRDEAIVGQWVYESGSTRYLFLENGEAFEVGVNCIGEHITTVDVREDGGYASYDSWYKKDGEYYWKTRFGGGIESVVHIDGDTLVFGDNVYEWYRVPEDEWISFDEIYYSTFDEENVAYVQHPLSEFIEE